MRDAVGAFDRLEAAVRPATDELLAGAAADPGPIFVGWVAADDATACPARFRAGGDEGWGFPGWSPATAAGAVARAALDRYLVEGPDGAAPGAAAAAGAPVDAGGIPPPRPVETVRAWMRAEGAVDARGVAGWVGELRSDGDGPTLAATAATAGRWLAGFVRVLGWPLPRRLALLNVTREGQTGAPRWWPRKGSPLTVGSGADARLGRVTGSGDFALVVHRPTTGDDDDLHRRAAFLAAAGTLAHRVAPDRIVVTAGDTGEAVTVPVDDDLLSTGGDAVVEVVRQRAIAVERGFDAADASPSPRCRWCAHAPDCPPGTAWLAGPGRWRGGLPAYRS